MYKPKFQASYDVIVLGFGGAGATAARFAADNGAKVLLVDAAPYGNEGGNTRYCAQLICSANDYGKVKKYYQSMTEPMNLPEKMSSTYIKSMSEMKSYISEFLDTESFDMGAYLQKLNNPVFNAMSHEYPEYSGNESNTFLTVHKGYFDAALWKILRQKVVERKDHIDVWLSSRAFRLIKDYEQEKIIGVSIIRDNKSIDVFASKGVVLAVGGFEANHEMIQNYLGADKLSPLGTIYNRGDGINMAIQVGAKLWHMWNYESLGILHGLSFATNNSRSILYIDEPILRNGSIFVVTTDGHRYFNESEINRHGHIKDHDIWRVPRTHQKIYLIFDQQKLDEIETKGINVSDFKDRIISADTIKQLAEKTGLNFEGLMQEIIDWNEDSKKGRDREFGRDPKSMAPFKKGKIYAVKLINNILNTQGGPERNEKGEILDTAGNPIPHLFGAGELGGICANEYQGGSNIAETLIWGKIAGENAAAVTDLATAKINKDFNGINDLILNKNIDTNITVNQYIGESSNGIGGKVVVKLTYSNKKIQKVEIVENHESKDIAKHALKIIPEKIVASNSTKVDAISGASTTSHAICEAVDNALSKARS